MLQMCMPQSCPCDENSGDHPSMIALKPGGWRCKRPRGRVGPMDVWEELSQ